MKNINLSIMSAVSVLLLSSCGSPGPAVEPGKVGATLSLGAASIQTQENLSVKSAEVDSCTIPVLEDQENGISISASVDVAPIAGDGLRAKATETTTANLSSFIVEGYLGDEILTCKGASQADKDNRHFIVSRQADKGSDNYWHFNGTKPQWRSCVNHHFWAYSGTPLAFTVSGSEFDQSSFSYVNNGDEDLVIAYQSQYWVDEKDLDGNYPLRNLTFKHALSEVSIDHSPIVFKQFSVAGGTGMEDASTGRLSISRVRMITSSNGSCTSSGGAFNWTYGTEDADYSDIECTNPDNTAFSIPQRPSNTTVVLSISDSWRGSVTPIFIELPETASVSTWQSGYKYTYQLSGTLCAPYYTPIGHLDPNFVGKNFQSFAILNNLLSKYVKKVVITWRGLAYCQSGSSPMAVVYLPKGQSPSSTIFPMENLSQTSEWKDQDNVGFVTDVNHNIISTPVKGSITGGNLNNPSSCVCRAEFIIPDTETGPVNFYLLYDGDNNGNASWKIYDMSIDVTEFKSPVQIVP